ncbi:MAG: hypothetical protein MJ246_07235 [Clostridia bacterium]|nr:hypothetical protein [Clostridia bacterium]
MKSVGFTKKLVISLILMLMIMVPVHSLSVMPSFSVQTVYAEEIEEEDEETAPALHYTVGVQREANLEENKQIFSDTVIDIAKVIFAFLVFVMILATGLNLIIHNMDGKSRAEVINKFKHIIYGVILFAAAAVIVAIATKFQDSLISDLYNNGSTAIPQFEEADSALDTNWFANIIELALKIIGRILEYFIQLLFAVISLDGSNIGNALSVNASQYNLNNILFLADFGDTINFDTVNAFGQKLTTAPFSVTEWSRYTSAYILLSTVAVPLMLIALIKVAYDMILHAGNFEKVIEVKNTSFRIVIGIIVVCLGPYLFRGILTFFNMLVYLIPVQFSFDIIVEDIEQTNGLLAVITTLWWLWIKFRVMLLFVVREIMLTVMYISTPLVIGMWAISEKTKAFNRWLGETVTNAATQFCYAMVFFMATVVLGGNSQPNTFFTLLWLSMMLKLANFFKELLQGIFDKWGGIDEAKVADWMADKSSGVATKFTNSTLDKVDKNRTTFGARLITNSMALKDAAKGGDMSGFVHRDATSKKLATEGIKDSTDAIKNAKALLNSDFLKNDPDGIALSAIYNGGYEIDGTKYRAISAYAKDSDEYAKLMAEANRIAGNGGVQRSHKDSFDEINKELENINKLRIIKSGASKDLKQNSVAKIIESSIADSKQQKLYEHYSPAQASQVSSSSYASNPSTGATPVSSEARGASAFKMQPVFSSERIRQALQDDGKAVTPQSMAEEQTIMQQRMNEKFLKVDKAIKRQNDAGRDTSISDNVRDKHAQATNAAVQDCVNHMAQLYKDGYLTQSSANTEDMLKKLDKYVDKVEKNADFDLYDKLEKEVNAIKSSK